MTPISVPSVDVKSVLVASGFSAESDKPVRHALAIARHYGAQFYVAHVAAPHRYSIGCAGAVRSAIDTTRRDSEQLNQELLQSGALDSLLHEFIVREGDPWAVLKQIIREKQVDLLVIGTHTSQTLDKSQLGSTAGEIFRHADCPVLTVGSVSDEDSPTQLDQGFNTLLFVTDFGAASSHALPYAVSFANHVDAKLTLLHVLPTVPTPEGFSWSVTTKDVTQMRENARSATLARLEELISKQAPLNISPEFIVEFGMAEGQILYAAQIHKADVIILGLDRSAHIDAASYLPWATAYQVVTGADCPVLTIRN